MYFSSPSHPTPGSTPSFSTPSNSFQSPPPSTPSLTSPLRTPGIELLKWKKAHASSDSLPSTPVLDSPITPYTYEAKSFDDENTPPISPTLAIYLQSHPQTPTDDVTSLPSTPTLNSPVTPYTYETQSYDDTTPPLSPSLARYSKFDVCETPPTPMLPSPPITTSFIMTGVVGGKEPKTPQSCSPQSHKLTLPSPCKCPEELYYK